MAASTPNPWFRMYSEFSTDPKVQILSEAMQRRLVMLFCFRCSDVLVTASDDELAFAMRIDTDELARTKAVFVSKGFIDDTWKILNWNKRQFVSDRSTERTRQYRERMRTSQVRHGDENVTAPEAEAEAEAEAEEKKKKKKNVADAPPPPPDPIKLWFESEFWPAWVKRDGDEKASALLAAKSKAKTIAARAEIMRRVAAIRESRLQEDTQYRVSARRWIREGMWKSAPEEAQPSTAQPKAVTQMLFPVRENAVDRMQRAFGEEMAEKRSRV